MNPPSKIRLFFRSSSVARRIIWLFVLCALFPLAISAWLANTAISELASALQAQTQLQSTQQITRQVFDRLQSASAMLAALPNPNLQDKANPPHRPTLANEMFSTIAWAVDSDVTAQGSANEAAILALWHQRPDHDQEVDVSRYQPNQAFQPWAILHVSEGPGQAQRLLLGSKITGQLRWVGELKPSYVFQPVETAAINSGWLVKDLDGRVLARQGDETLVPQTNTTTVTPPSRFETSETILFMRAEFSTPDWVFVQRSTKAQALWYGQPLLRWLSLLAVATLLVSGLASYRLIRRTLVPLEVLKQGTKQLACGATDARVAVRSQDEFGALGESFNTMADRIEQQIHTLEALALIDQRVLQGAPIHQIVQLVLKRFTQLYPGTCCAIFWMENARSCTLHGVNQIGDQSLTFTQELTSNQVVEFSTLSGDEIKESWPNPSAPWGLPTRTETAQSPSHFGLLPLRWGDETRAAFVIGLYQPAPAAEAVQAAGELRDRLAVALSARQREAEMLYGATHDSLTEQVNRRGLYEFLDQLLVAPNGENPFAVIFIDLDHFKNINDGLGHAHGDEVLRQASQRLVDIAPLGAVVARQGGDEFVIVLPGAKEAQARKIATEVTRCLELPFSLAHWSGVVGSSIGISLYPQHGRTRDDLLRFADMAMYRSKAAGRGRHTIFDQSFEAETQARLLIPNELRKALQLGQLRTYYQRRVRPGDRCITSCEALIRWQHPKRGLLGPNEFISLAEESEVIEDIGGWILGDACAQMAQWHHQASTLSRVSVNVSPRQFSSGKFVDQVFSTLRQCRLPPNALELEVTESLLAENTNDAWRQLAELRKLGVTVALDDFGTGFSSMSMLRNLPIDVLKIDRSFVRDITTHRDALAITGAIATMAHSLGLHLVAEGIETPAQAELLLPMNCNEFQGFLFGRPEPHTQLLSSFRSETETQSSDNA